MAVNGYKFDRIAHISGIYGGNAPRIGDADHNGLDELIFGKAVLEYHPVNQYLKVYEIGYSDTIFTGIGCVGDGDKDGLSEFLMGTTIQSHTERWHISYILESKDPHSFPSDTIWMDTCTSQIDTIFTPRKFTDLDSDGKEELFGRLWWYDKKHGRWGLLGEKIYENRGDNTYIPVFFDSIYVPGPYVFGDFDGDGKEGWFATGGVGNDTARIWECVSDDDYKIVWRDTRIGIDVYDAWLGNDTDGDGKPEIFLKTYRPTILQMYEATGDNTYEFKVIDTIWQASSVASHSACGDVDGDGREEVVVSLGTKIVVYKAVGDDKYEKVWEWWNDMGHFYHDMAYVACHDFNKNGYDEIVVTDQWETSIFEIDTTYGITSRPPVVKPPNLSISPNPTKKSTVISLQLPVKEIINLKVYDATGRLINTLARAEGKKSGVYTIEWDGKDSKGNSLPSGVYFCELKTQGYRLTRKLILISR